MDSDKYYAQGSDDFRTYIWKIPSNTELLQDRKEVDFFEWGTCPRPGETGEYRSWSAVVHPFTSGPRIRVLSHRHEICSYRHIHAFRASDRQVLYSVHPPSLEMSLTLPLKVTSQSSILLFSIPSVPFSSRPALNASSAFTAQPPLHPAPRPSTSLLRMSVLLFRAPRTTYYVRSG